MNPQQNILSVGELNLNQSQGLGWVGVLIAAVASVAPMVIKAFQKPPKDEWSSWDIPAKAEYVTQGLKVATNAVLSGKASDVEQVLQPIIAQVELDEDWPTWKRRNPAFVQMIQQARMEVQQAKQGNYSTNFQFVDSNAVAQAGMFNNSKATWIIIGLLFTAGLAYGIKTNIIKL